MLFCDSCFRFWSAINFDLSPPTLSQVVERRRRRIVRVQVKQVEEFHRQAHDSTDIQVVVTHPLGQMFGCALARLPLAFVRFVTVGPGVERQRLLQKSINLLDCMVGIQVQNLSILKPGFQWYVAVGDGKQEE